jgi:hypothetical protein
MSQSQRNIIAICDPDASASPQHDNKTVDYLKRFASFYYGLVIFPVSFRLFRPFICEPVSTMGLENS